MILLIVVLLLIVGAYYGRQSYDRWGGFVPLVLVILALVWLVEGYRF